MPESDSGTDSVLDQPIEIPQSDWSKFLDDFSTSHNLWTVTLEVLGSDGDHDVEIRERPLLAIGFDNVVNSHINIWLGAKPNSTDRADTELTHSVIVPLKMTMLPGAAIVLSIEAGDGTVTVLRCTRVKDSRLPGAIAA